MMVDEKELDERRYQYYLGLVAQIMALLQNRTPVPSTPPPVERAFDALRRYEAGFERRARGMAEEVAAGRLSIPEFRDRMADEIRYLHITAAAIARGRLAALTPEDVIAVNQAVERQRRYLDRWTQSMLDPTPTDVTHLASRAAMYASAGRATMSAIHAAAIGMPELPFHPGDRTECLTHCGCRWTPVKLDGDGNWDVFWTRAKDDSCRTCLAREAACSPLRIRGGLIMPFNATGTIA